MYIMYAAFHAEDFHPVFWLLQMHAASIMIVGECERAYLVVPTAQYTCMLCNCTSCIAIIVVVLKHFKFCL